MTFYNRDGQICMEISKFALNNIRGGGGQWIVHTNRRILIAC